jgi:formylglycine-generating enzyme
MAAMNFASAEIIRGINIDFVTIGHAGNAGEQSRLVIYGDTTYYGAVSSSYRIGKYEITNAQWNTFIAAAGAPTGNDGGYGGSAYWTNAQQPTGNVSWYEATQFCNYLTSGDKSKGAYQFSGNNTNPGSFVGIDRVSSISTYGTTYVIPTEDEWYKAAYFKPNGSGYSLYANGTNTAPIAGVNSNYNYVINAPWDITNGTQEQNGTFNMMGNVWEWNETLLYGSDLGIRSGSFYDGDHFLASYARNGHSFPSDQFSPLGFRVASVPEPATLLLLGFSVVMLRKKHS